MLVLSRKTNERVTITVPPSEHETSFEIVVASMDHGKVRLGFDAPKAIKVFRTELLDGQEKWEEGT